MNPIKTDADYQRALSRIEGLMMAERGTPEGDELDSLVTLVEAYEERHSPLESPTVMTINGYRALITYDPEIEMFRGEFVGLAGGADFYGRDIDGLRHEGEVSLRVLLEAYDEDGVEPRKP